MACPLVAVHIADHLDLMRLLALETSTTAGSVAAFADERLLAELTLDAGQKSARSLAPAMAELWKTIGWKPADVEMIAVGVGPGSFTGLRVGLTTAKTLAYAVGASVIGVNTLLAIAHRAPPDVERLWAIIDAYRGQVFAALVEREPNKPPTELEPTAAIDEAAWLARLSSGDVVTGPGLVKLRDRIPSGVVALPEALWPATAKAVGEIGWQQYMAGARDDLWALAPQYYRRSAAEELRDGPR
jgi:tRNA threonylcarbamoyladenosine biosynthesis protein TsaB